MIGALFLGELLFMLMVFGIFGDNKSFDPARLLERPLLPKAPAVLNS